MAFATFTRNAYYLISRALIRLSAADTGFLGGAGLSQDAIAAELVSEAERETREAHPGLGLARSEVTILQGQSSVAFPGAIWQQRLTQVFYRNPGNTFEDMMPIRIADRSDGEIRPPGESSIQGGRIPIFVYPDWERTSLVANSVRPQDTTLLLEYLTAPRNFTASDLGAGSVVYSTVPDEYDDTVFLRLAISFAEHLGAGYETKMALAERALAKADERLTRAVAGAIGTLGNPWNDQGRPSGALVNATLRGFPSGNLTNYVGGY